jgi:hypothetical protein
VSYVEYSSNNSGGSWWLTDKNWYDLEAAGWEVQWVKDQEDGIFHNKGEERWLGALATNAIRRDVSLGVAKAEFEDVTGLSPYDEGCDCCGQPHYFSEHNDDGSYIR